MGKNMEQNSLMQLDMILHLREGMTLAGFGI